jgi:high-affinity K+ transport system ATPase subunit B
LEVLAAVVLLPEQTVMMPESLSVEMQAMNIIHMAVMARMLLRHGQLWKCTAQAETAVAEAVVVAVQPTTIGGTMSIPRLLVFGRKKAPTFPAKAAKAAPAHPASEDVSLFITER